MKDPVEVLSALSSKRRLQIIEIITQGELTTSEIAKKLNIAPSTASRHLSILEKAEIIISTEKLGKGNRPTLFYSLKTPFKLILEVKSNLLRLEIE